MKMIGLGHTPDPQTGTPAWRWRAVTYAAIATVAVLLIGLSALRVYAIRLRHRGEQLQAQAMKLKVGVSTPQDVEKFIQSSGLPYVQSGPGNVGSCNGDECYFVVFADSFYFRGGEKSLLGSRPIRALGIRPAAYSAIIHLSGGVVNQVTSTVFYLRNDGWQQFVNSTAASKMDGAFQGRSRPAYLPHPGYFVRVEEMRNSESRGPFGDFILAWVTPEAAMSNWQSARTIDFACVTRISQCSVAELMPLAYRDWKRDSESQKSGTNIGSQAGALTGDRRDSF